MKTTRKSKRSRQTQKRSPRRLKRGVMLRPLEITMLIRAYRERAYNCRMMVIATTDLKVQGKLRVAALRCENRADELAQHNTKLCDGGAQPKDKPNE